VHAPADRAALLLGKEKENSLFFSLRVDSAGPDSTMLKEFLADSLSWIRSQ
jgi:hypothetical protein